MSVIMKKEPDYNGIEIRKAYFNTLIELGEKDERIVLLEADLAGCIGSPNFGKKYPDRYFNCGIQEANMIGMAVGMASCGMVPYAHTFCAFITRRAFDQIFISGGYAKSNLHLFGTDPGIAATINGGTHMAFEDIGLMRNIPDATIFEVSDAVMLEDLIRQTNNKYGIYYFRVERKSTASIYEKGSKFEIGKAVKLCGGEDATIIASGCTVIPAIKAAALLKEKGVNATVLDMFTIKPLDSDAIIESAKKTGLVVTCENHNVATGLGSAVNNLLAKECPTKTINIGPTEQFGQVGDYEFLAEYYGLTAENIAETVLDALGKKLQ